MMSSQSENLIELRQVHRQFGAQVVLRDLTMEVRRGETLVIIGESGCGKSVTTKLMAGLLYPTAGDVYWDGRNLRDFSADEADRYRLRIGYLFQQAALFDSMTVFENVGFGLLQNTTLNFEQIEQIVHQRIRDVGLPVSVCRKKPSQLSGGMRKRVGLARALALAPQIMLYDEPTTGLDPIMSDVINELILKTRNDNNMTSIVVTHDMRTVRRIADRVVMLYPLSRLEGDEPQVVFQGTAEEVFETDDPRVAQFVRGEAGDRINELAVA